jgi:hypothetical protein
MNTTTHTTLGLSEQELRDAIAEELTLSFRAEGDTATIHAIAHSVARVLELDHLRMAEQLEHVGVKLGSSLEHPQTRRRRIQRRSG